MQRSDHFNNLLATSFAWCIPVAASYILRYFLEHFDVASSVADNACFTVQVVGAIGCLVGTVYAWN